MSLGLKFGADVFGPVTALRVQRGGEAPETSENWQVRLQFDAPTPVALEALLLPIRNAHGATADLRTVDGATEVRGLTTSDCRQGPTLTGIQEHDPSPGEAHNRRDVTLTFDSLLQDAVAAIQSNVSTLTKHTLPGTPARILHSGRAVLRGDEVPADHEAAVLPALAPGYRRVKSLITRDAAVPAIIYEVEDEQIFAVLPGGVDDGHYVVTDAQDAAGRVVRTISGFFAGASAKGRALELRPADDFLLYARVTDNPFSRRVDFEFREALPDADAIARAESLTFTTTRRLIDHVLLDASRPVYRQHIGGPQTEVVQEGSAVGIERHPAPPPVRFAADLIERKVHYSIPHPALPADRRWVTTWRYVSRARAAISESTP